MGRYAGTLSVCENRNATEDCRNPAPRQSPQANASRKAGLSLLDRSSGRFQQAAPKRTEMIPFSPTYSIPQGS
jgi:hypothetical protein